jgi:septum formation protein
VTVVLASQSPRRRELLLSAGIPHAIRVADVDEAVQAGESPISYVRRLAREKALAIPCAPGEIVIGADTTVACDGHILGKPANQAEARSMLQTLAAKRHEVITGICLRYGKHISVHHETTGVWFTPVSEEDIDALSAPAEALDKAGAYAIQGIASRYIHRIEGSYSNVVGLPVALVWREMNKIRNLPSEASSSPEEA